MIARPKFFGQMHPGDAVVMPPTHPQLTRGLVRVALACVGGCGFTASVVAGANWNLDDPESGPPETVALARGLRFVKDHKTGCLAAQRAQGGVPTAVGVQVSIVRFATICDHCGARSEEYTAWPRCRECGAHTCPSCAAPGTTTDDDLDAPATCRCRQCDQS